MSAEMAVTAIVVAITFSLLIYAYIKKKINGYALLGSVVLGAIVLLTVGCIGVLALLLFFMFGNIVTSYKYEEKARIGVAESNKGRRTLHNVFGNGISPMMFGVAYALSHQNPIFLIGFSGAVATACADTFSTEIGQALCRYPRLITNMRHVPVGTSGGVSVPGLLAALLGSSLIAIPVWLLSCLSHSCNGLLSNTSFADRSEGIALLATIILSGFLGGIADSILGATLENRNKLNKHEVNVLATLSGGMFAILLSFLFFDDNVLKRCQY